MEIIRINDLENAETLLYDHNREIGRTLPDEDLIPGIRKFIKDGEVLGIVEGNRIVAMLNLYCNNYETLSAYICNVYVLEEYRGKHIAKDLMERAIEICKSRDFKNVKLHVTPDNTPAVKIYRSLGFDFTGNQNASKDYEMTLNFDSQNYKKRLLILGAGNAQLDLIKEAKRLDYYVIVCDYRPNMVGSIIANKYYQVNYMEKDVVIDIAKIEKIDGVISNSEPVMPIVAEISQCLNLPGNTVESVGKLISKSEFRKLQKSCHLYTPKSYIVKDFEKLVELAQKMEYPIIVKPTESSGTRGTTKVDVFDEQILKQIYLECKDYSRDDTVSIEEYVSMKNFRVNESDVFVIGNKFLWDGMTWTDRAEYAPMVPRTYSFPVVMPESKMMKLKNTVESLIREAGITLGEYNVEAYYTKNNDVFVIEINPRQGGNHIPQLIEQYSGVDFTKLLVSTAVNDMSYFRELDTFERTRKYVTHHVVFSKDSGVLDSIYIDESIKPYIKWMEQDIENGSMVHQCRNAFDAIACVNFEFDSCETQEFFVREIEKFIHPILREQDC
ncbi:GNAT family N-acetyltransferase [Holdemanella biformis]|nr:GNAT family N-acetyltransferase [Holdemanella biformis]